MKNASVNSRTGKVGLAAITRFCLIVAAAGAGGWFLRNALAPIESAPTSHASGESDLLSAAPTIWTCAMHPQVQLDEPGACPLCGMDLIPLSSGEASGVAGGEPGSDRRIRLTPQARAQIRIRTHPVERRFVEAEVRMVGKLQYDETRLAYLTAWAPGRLDRLFVDYAGVEVAAGDHMVSLYSPKIYTDQTALLAALAAVRFQSQSASGIEIDTVTATLDAARERLRQLGLTPGQIEEIERRGSPSDHITIHSPIGGVVVDKNGQPGMYVDEGTRIYTIADLSHLWVQLDAYESDLAWLHYGQAVEFTTEAYAGDVFHGTIAFLAKELDPKTLTVKVRVHLDNSEGRLKPGMFVRAVVRTKVATKGRVMDADLSGKWICSMHPEIVRDTAGLCDLCEMDLVTTESLGYVPLSEAEREMPLVIPATAALRTGRRAVVYVEIESEDGPLYEGREVLLGPRAGDWYLVQSGLAEGERVVTNGNFKLDSALQIRAQPSMMSAPRLELDQDFTSALEEIWSAYLRVQEALLMDSAKDAAQAASSGSSELKLVSTETLNMEQTGLWDRISFKVQLRFKSISGTDDLDIARSEFEQLSAAVRDMLLKFELDIMAYEVDCPMAFGRGARWLQATDSIGNPYLGQRMSSCGTVLGQLGNSEYRDE